MKLTQVYSREMSLSEDEFPLAISFDDREYCIHQLFWSLISNLEKGNKSLVICANSKDLKELNYLFSKYGLSRLSVALDGAVLENNPRHLIEIKNLEYQPSKDFNTIQNLKDSTTKIVSAARKLNLEKIGNKTVVDIIDMVDEASLEQIEVDQHILNPPYSYNNYLAKKQLIQKAEKLYDPKFKDLAHFDPLNYIESLSSADQLSLLDDYIERAEEIAELMQVQESKAKHLIAKDIDEELSQIQQLFTEVKALIMQGKLNNTDEEKLIYSEKLLYQLLDISSPPATKIEEAYRCFEIIKSKFSKRKTLNHPKIEREYSNFIKRLAVTNEHFPELPKIQDKIEKLGYDILNQNLLVDFKLMFSMNFYYLKEKLHSIISQLNLARHFCEANKEYYNWKSFFNSISEEDQSIIEHLARRNQFWPNSFEELFLASYLNNQRSELSSINSLMGNLDYDLSNPELKQELIQAILSNNQEALQLDSTLSSRTWDEVFEAYSKQFQQRFPIIFIEESVSKSLLPRLLASSENIFYFNSLPKSPPEEDWLNLSFLGYEDFFIAGMKKLKIPELHSNHNPRLYTEINKNLNQMDRVERSKAARYLGQRLYFLNDECRIYQNKNLSFISYWSDAKNAKLLDEFQNYDLKEIVSNRTATNLLPGIFADQDKQTFILIEDSLIRVSESFNPIHQLDLLNELKIAGVKVVSVDNWALIFEREEVYSKLFNNLRGTDSSNQERQEQA